jgi:DNA replication protein DnaC
LGNFDVTKQKSLARKQLGLLADPEWLDLHKNILILGPSAARKTHLAAALGREWCSGRKVLFSKAAQLIEKLSHARPRWPHFRLTKSQEGGKEDNKVLESVLSLAVT